MKFIFFILSAVSLWGACPFCDPAILDKQMVYEGKEVVVLYSLTPATKGNVLIIPRRHIERFDDLTASEMLEIQALISKMSQAFKEVYSSTDYFIMQKNGELAGQSQPHTHFHVFPCKEQLSKIVIKAMLYNPPISDEEMEERCMELREYFSEKSANQ